MPTSQPVQILKHALTGDQVLSPYVYVFYASFLVAFVFTPVMRSIAMYYGIVDKPDMIRKLHASPVAYLGGVAVFLGWLAGMAMTQGISTHIIEPGLDDRLRVPIAIICAALIIVTIGLWDDLQRISPRIKIAGQLLAGVTLLAQGIGTELTKFIVTNITVRLSTKLGIYVSPDVTMWAIYLTSIPLTLGLVVFCCNATNLMDGLDGLCGGVTSIIAIGFVFLAIVIAQPERAYASIEEMSAFVNADGLRVAIALALLGAILGFVPFNFNPASIFMGDTGSMFLGFAMALMMIMLGSADGKWLLAGMVMFALPVLDTSLAFARRYVARRPFFSADRHHFHHQLVQRGFTVKKAVLVSYALTTFFVICGISVVYLRTRYAVAFYLVLFCSIIVSAYKMGMVHERAVVEKTSDLSQNNSAQSLAGEIAPEGVLEVRQERPIIDL